MTSTWASAQRIGEDVEVLRATDIDGSELERPEDWAEWSKGLGERLIDSLRGLESRLPGIRAAMLSTADGFNICTLGVDALAVSQLASLTSSLHSLAAASARTFFAESVEAASLVATIAGSTTFVVTSIPERTSGSLLLLVAVEHGILGTVIVQAQLAAEEIRARLAEGP